MPFCSATAPSHFGLRGRLRLPGRLLPSGNRSRVVGDVVKHLCAEKGPHPAFQILVQDARCRERFQSPAERRLTRNLPRESANPSKPTVHPQAFHQVLRRRNVQNRLFHHDIYLLQPQNSKITPSPAKGSANQNYPTPTKLPPQNALQTQPHSPLLVTKTVT